MRVTGLPRARRQTAINRGHKPGHARKEPIMTPRLLLISAVLALTVLLGGCVAYPAYPGYAAYPAYGYPAPYYGGGYVAYGGGWHDGGWRR
jgi:hypothetical protein